LRHPRCAGEAGENDNLIVQKLVANKNAFGIFGFSFLEENTAKLRGVALDGVDPTYDNIASGKYKGSRLLYALALDRRRMGLLSYVHPRFRTPSFAIVVHTTVALALALGGSFRQLALISAMARLTTYLVTCLAIPNLRKLTAGSAREGFRTPGYIVPILGVLVSLVFVWNLNAQKLLVAAIALTIGALLYFVSKPRVVH